MIIAARGPSAASPLISHFLLFLDFNIHSVAICCSPSPSPPLLSFFFPSSPLHPPHPISLSGLSLYSLIAHNHSQSVSVTNRPIRVGLRPYGRQAAAVTVSSIRFLPSTHASVSRLCDSKENLWLSRLSVTLTGQDSRFD